jgi:hypothetical protein
LRDLSVRNFLAVAALALTFAATASAGQTQCAGGQCAAGVVVFGQPQCAAGQCQAAAVNFTAVVPVRRFVYAAPVAVETTTVTRTKTRVRGGGLPFRGGLRRVVFGIGAGLGCGCGN